MGLLITVSANETLWSIYYCSSYSHEGGVNVYLEWVSHVGCITNNLQINPSSRINDPGELSTFGHS